MAPQFFSRKIMVGVCMLTFVYMVSVRAQGNDNNQAHDSYAVIGAFTVQGNAQRLVELVKKYDLKAVIRNNEHRGLFYVYVAQSSQREDIVKKVAELKTNYPEFYDAWAYTGDFTEKPKPQIVVANKSESTDTSKETLVASRNTTTGVAAPPMKADEKENDEKASDIEKKAGHYYLYFNAINSRNLKEVKGNINIIDPERVKQLKEARSHELVELEDPNNGTRKIKVASSIFGFREIQHTIDLDDPESLAENPAVEMIGDSIVVNFDLQRFKKSDVLVMYNVYFFKDAAIMKPESIYELNSLLDMLKENENLVVRIHGHTNGNSHGKVIHLDLDDKNFFGINGNHKESHGSAKKLSLYRAYTIQHWLMEQGVSEERMDIKGWGGKRMIYDKHSTQADKNVRVEVEILEE